MVVSFSHSEKVLLLLEDHDHYRDALEVPFTLCQEGMAEGLGLQLQNMSRTLSKMQAEGLISERLAHVRGVGRRRKVYRLTVEGRDSVSELVDDIRTREVMVVEGGTSRTMLVGELIGMLSSRGKTIPMLALAEALSARSFSLDDLPAGTQRSTVPSRSMAIGKPDPTVVVGREKELETLANLLDDPRVKDILIWGLPGMGKTALGMALFDRLDGKRPLFWYTVKDFNSESSFLDPFLSMLRGSGRQMTSTTLPSSDLAKLYAPLVSDLARWKGVIFIDDVHKAVGGMEMVLNLILEACEAQNGTKLIFMSRKMVRAFSQNKEGLVDMELQGLTPADAAEVIRRAGPQGVPPSLEGVNGNPLLIQMVLRAGRGAGPKAHVDYVDDLWALLTPEEKQGLKALSVYRDFVPPSALPVDTTIVMDLRAKGIVEQRGSSFLVHDLVRDRILQLMNDEERRRFHRMAWDHYSRTTQDEQLMEGLYHLMESGDHLEFVRVLERKGRACLDRPDDLIPLVDKVLATAGDGGSRYTLLYWRARALLSVERYDEASRDIELILAATDLDQGTRALALECMADLHNLVDEWDEALARYRETLAQYEASGDVVSQVREWLNIGRTLRIRGDHQASLDAYHRAAELRPKDQRLKASIANNQGMVLWDAGKMNEAEVKFRESIRLSRSNNDAASEGMALQNLADMYQESLRYDEMMLAARDASDAFLRAASYDDFVDMQVRIASHLEESGRPQQGLDVLLKALTKVQGTLLGPGPAASRVELGLKAMAICRNMGRSREALEIGASLEDARHVPPGILARSDLEQALAAEDLGELDRAWDHLLGAEAKLTEVGDQVGLTLILIEKGEVEERRGNAEAAAKLYREAVWRAEGTGDMMGLATALEYLVYIIGIEEDEGRRAAKRAMATYHELGLPERSERMRRSLAIADPRET